MLTKQKESQHEAILYTLDELVPENHIVRKLDKINYDFIYDEVKELYANDGRPSIDPIILFKIYLIKNFFNIKSINQTLKEIEVNVAYRWFLRIPFSEKLPHYSVISNNFNYRFNKLILNNIFKQIITELNNLNLGIEKTFLLNKGRYKIKRKAKNAESSLYDTTLV